MSIEQAAAEATIYTDGSYYKIDHIGRVFRYDDQWVKSNKTIEDIDAEIARRKKRNLLLIGRDSGQVKGEGGGCELRK